MTAFVRMSVDTSEVDKALADLRKDQVPFAAALAVNELAKDIVRIEKVEIQTSFDRPTPFIQRGMRVLKFANKRDPSALVSGQGDKNAFLSDYAESVQRVLTPQIQGGRRKPLPSEKALRSLGVIAGNEWLIGAKRRTNAYGNIAGPEYRRMLAFYRRGETPINGYRFVVEDIGRSKGIFRVKGKKGKPMLMWVVTTNEPGYKKRFDFYGEAQRHAKQFAPYFAKKAMEKALLTVR